jgi:uncharacterized membrane protein
MPLLLPVHIIAAAVGLLAGAIALSVSKGATLHRKAGRVFVYAMVAMCGTAIVMAVFRRQPVNIIAGSMTAYLAITALTTVRPPSAESRRLNTGLMIVAFMLGIAMFAAGFVALARGRLGGLPSFPFFLFGVLGISGAIGDFQTLRAGTLRGAARLSRHLWRMCMALFITTASFFSIRARVAAVLPAPFTTPVMRTIPVLLVLVVMFYWLRRVRSRRSDRRLATFDGTASLPA